MKIRTLLFAVLICNCTLDAQTLNLKIVNAQTQEAIPYVAIFSKDNKEGSYADEQGRFVFEFSPGVDTILFSAVGFSLEKMSLNQALGSKILALTPIVVNLPDVTILSKSQKEVETNLGYFKRFRGLPTFAVHTNINNRFALLIKNPLEKPGWVNKLRVRFDVEPSKIAAFYRIQLRVYANDAGKPGKDLLSVIQPVDIETNQQSLTQEISSRHLLFPVEGVFLGYDVLGYADKQGAFHLFKRGQKVPIGKKMEWDDFLCPGVAVDKKQKVVEVFEANGLGPWYKSFIVQFGAPMFGIVASFKE